mmetsp:Transcript_13243/g.16850  ORF Transcript_13243/g.16850 Transcript_13243/m.16850 type:complete len:455 (+) Transcript_13243:1-1365(+)
MMMKMTPIMALFISLTALCDNMVVVDAMHDNLAKHHEDFSLYESFQQQQQQLEQNQRTKHHHYHNPRNADHKWSDFLDDDTSYGNDAPGKEKSHVTNEGDRLLLRIFLPLYFALISMIIVVACCVRCHDQRLEAAEMEERNRRRNALPPTRAERKKRMERLKKGMVTKMVMCQNCRSSNAKGGGLTLKNDDVDDIEKQTPYNNPYASAPLEEPLLLEHESKQQKNFISSASSVCSHTTTSSSSSDSTINYTTSRKQICPICIEKYKKGDIVSWSMCSQECAHVFHNSCIIHWLKLSNECPCCRSEYVPVVPSSEDKQNEEDAERGTSSAVGRMKSWFKREKRNEEEEADLKEDLLDKVKQQNDHEQMRRDSVFCIKRGLILPHDQGKSCCGCNIALVDYEDKPDSVIVKVPAVAAAASSTRFALPDGEDIGDMVEEDETNSLILDDDEPHVVQV